MPIHNRNKQPMQLLFPIMGNSVKGLVHLNSNKKHIFYVLKYVRFLLPSQQGKINNIYFLKLLSTKEIVSMKTDLQAVFTQTAFDGKSTPPPIF